MAKGVVNPRYFRCVNLVQLGLLVVVLLAVFRHDSKYYDKTPLARKGFKTLGHNTALVLSVSAASASSHVDAESFEEDYMGEVLDDEETFESGPYEPPEEEDMTKFTDETYRRRRDGKSPEKVLNEERRTAKQSLERLRRKVEITDEQLLEAAKKVFDLIDKDKSDFLEPAEIDEWYTYLADGMSKLHVLLEKPRMDLNEDGVISQKEFVKRSFSIGHAPAAVLKEIFNDADKNADGVLTDDEMWVFFTINKDPRLCEEDAQYTLERFDIDKDGKVSYPEYHKNNFAADETTEEAMKFYDADGDGYATLEELKNGICQMPKHDFRLFMRRFQLDPDIGVSRAKWLKNYELTMFSPLTHHGELFDDEIYNLKILPQPEKTEEAEL